MQLKKSCSSLADRNQNQNRIRCRQYLDSGNAGALHTSPTCLQAELTEGSYKEPSEKAIRLSLYCWTSSASWTPQTILTSS